MLTGLATVAAPAVSGSEGPPAISEVEGMPGLTSSLRIALHVAPSLAAPAALAPVEALLPAMLQVTLLCHLSRLCFLALMHCWHVLVVAAVVSGLFCTLSKVACLAGWAVLS